MPNPNPPLNNLKPFKPKGQRPMAKAALCVRLPVEIDNAIRSLGNRRTEWLRQVIIEAAQRDLKFHLSDVVTELSDTALFQDFDKFINAPEKYCLEIEGKSRDTTDLN